MIEERQVVTTNEGMLKENGVRDGKFCYRKREDGRHAKRTGETEKNLEKKYKNTTCFKYVTEVDVMLWRQDSEVSLVISVIPYFAVIVEPEK